MLPLLTYLFCLLASFVHANLGFVVNDVLLRRPYSGRPYEGLPRQMASLERSDDTITALTTDSTESRLSPFDEASYENDRLEQDARAMDAMKAEADMEFAKGLRTPWKWTLRKRIWDYMEEKDIARFPRPVHHRIPNFVGADLAAERLADLPEFRAANMIKSNPDTPQ
jgi:5-formyltetrahydrofolate cyclo-ligase